MRISDWSADVCSSDLHFDFIELVLADHAAYNAPAAAGLGPEARGMGRQFERQVALRGDGIAHRPGQRDFRRGYQVKVFSRAVAVLVVRRGFVVAALGHPKHIVLEFGQLARAEQSGTVDDIRCVAFLVAMFAGLQIQHELRQRAVQARHRTAQHRSEEHTSELQSLMRISYAVFCLKKTTTKYTHSAPNT